MTPAGDTGSSSDERRPEVAARIEARAAELVASFPPLTDEQIDLLAGLLRVGTAPEQHAARSRHVA